MGAKKGDKVRVHYTGTLRNGEQFDSSRGRSPLEFTVGAGQMIPGFDRGVEGMEPGETKTLTLFPEEAYGERREDLLFTVERCALPKGYTPSEGDQLSMRQRNGGAMTVTVRKVGDDSVVLDGNHHLAGQDLIFDVELVEIL